LPGFITAQTHYFNNISNLHWHSFAAITCQVPEAPLNGTVVPASGSFVLLKTNNHILLHGRLYHVRWFVRNMSKQWKMVIKYALVSTNVLISFICFFFSLLRWIIYCKTEACPVSCSALVGARIGKVNSRCC